MSANGSDELSALREQRRLALQQQFEEQAKVQADAEIETQRQQIESQSINKALKHLLTSEARSRIARISLATPERADSIKKLIICIARGARLKRVILQAFLNGTISSDSLGLAISFTSAIYCVSNGVF